MATVTRFYRQYRRRDLVLAGLYPQGEYNEVPYVYWHFTLSSPLYLPASRCESIHVTRAIRK